MKYEVIIKDYSLQLSKVPLMCDNINCDNINAINLTKNPVKRFQTKHIEIRHRLLLIRFNEKVKSTGRFIQ